MVMVFDQYGKQMPELQGAAKEARAKLRAAGYVGNIEHRIWRSPGTEE
jgi:hypothetical protein